MLLTIHPKLPMRNKAATKDYYLAKLGFTEIGKTNYRDYLMVKLDEVEIHFFLYADLDPSTNYGQVYIRTDRIVELYKWMNEKEIPIHPNGTLEIKPWGQKEFSLLDPDNNLLTFGQAAVG